MKTFSAIFATSILFLGFSASGNAWAQGWEKLGSRQVDFGADKDTVIVVGADGSVYKASFADGGDCTKKAYSKFIKGDDDE